MGMRFWSRLKHEERGIAAVEFAAIAPAFLVIVMGGLDLGYTLYIQSVLNGTVQKAARDSSLETGTETATQTVIDTKVRNALLSLNKTATITIKRDSYQNFTKAQAQQPEDVNGINGCEAGENYYDRNFNGRYDDDGGDDSQGGAKDVVIYKVSMSFTRLFPVTKLIGLPANVTLIGRSVIANQPYADQAVHSGAIPLLPCP
jgi:Flp pilus assembly pilin Flp